MKNNIIEYIQSNGGRARMMPLSIIKTLEHDTRSVQSSPYGSDLIDLIGNVFFSFESPNPPFPALSILIMATPNPYVNVGFSKDGKSYTFINENSLDAAIAQGRIERTIMDMATAQGYHLHAIESLPMKPLAVRSGLAQYGRNNVTYVEGLGSFIALHAYVCDIPCGEITPQPLTRMPSCENCSACMRQCPTRAIMPDRHIIEARRCMTYLNEFVDLCDFPHWLPLSAHHSLHGCIVCQNVCPQNRPYLEAIKTPVEFDEEQTRILMQGIPMDEMPQALIEKLRLLQLEDYVHLLPRNLGVLFEKADIVTEST